MAARELPGSPAGRTWRLPMRWRLMLIAIQALIPGMAAATFWVPLTGLFHAFLDAGLTLERFAEGAEPTPAMLAIRARK